MRGDRPSFIPHLSFLLPFTPHARGSTVILNSRVGVNAVYPACAGIDLVLYSCTIRVPGLPRMRGDRPHGKAFTMNLLQFTPHARGSTHVTFSFFTSIPVYPACAGIDLGHLGGLFSPMGLPRMRGDRPVQPTSSVGYVVFTPHARGSTAFPSVEDSSLPVYPACAGIDL